MASSLLKQKKLILSYITDIIILAIFAAIGVALNYASPTRRLFSIVDASIAFPNYPDTVSIPVVFVVAVIVPAAVIFLVSLIFVKPLSIDKSPIPSKLLWRRKLWEFFAGILGLAFSVILGFFLTQALKNLYGKPRPDFLARCNPSITDYSRYIDGGYNSEGLEGSSLVFGSQLCRAATGTPAEQAALNDGYRSFPSGHCTISFAGLTYLSFFLAAKFAATIPHLSTRQKSYHDTDGTTEQGAREEAAGPPLHMFILAFIPTAGAIYIASTRFSDYKHHGFDVLFSSFEGIACAWLAFRWYHMPIRGSGGWAWCPRANEHAFGATMGTGLYRHRKQTEQTRSQTRSEGTGLESPQDIELGTLAPRRTLDSSSSRAPFASH